MYCIQVRSFIISTVINPVMFEDLVFLYASLNQIQMCLFEAIKTTVCPLAGIGFLWIFVSALNNFWSNNGFVFTLSQLFHQTINVETIFLIEKSHFTEDAFDVALCFFVVGEIKFLVFVYFVFGYAE